MQVGSIPPPAHAIQRRPGEPQQSLDSLRPLKILVMLAGMVGRSYRVSRAAAVRESPLGVLET